jgi:hypothetical protein
MRGRTPRQLLMLAALTAGICAAQLQSRPGGGAQRPGGTGRLVQIEQGAVVDEDNVRTARETVTHSMDTPTWPRPAGFERDVFTFARIIFQSGASSRSLGRGFGGRLGWWVTIRRRPNFLPAATAGLALTVRARADYESGFRLSARIKTRAICSW